MMYDIYQDILSSGGDNLVDLWYNINNKIWLSLWDSYKNIRTVDLDSLLKNGYNDKNRTCSFLVQYKPLILNIANYHYVAFQILVYYSKYQQFVSSLVTDTLIVKQDNALMEKDYS